MTTDFDSNHIPSKKEREERVLDLHFNQNKNYRQIAKEMKMSVRDIGETVNRAREEKERQEHKSLAVQAYELFSKGKTPLQVAIDLNIGEAQALQYHTQYLRLVRADDVTKIYLELKDDIPYFIELCKEAKTAKMGVSQVVKLLKIANNYLPSVEHKYEILQRQNNELESNLRTAASEFQNLSNHIYYMNNRLDDIKSECKREAALLQGLRQQTARLDAFVYNYKNNDEEYVKLIKSIENKAHNYLSGKKTFFKMAIISLIDSMRNNPEKYSVLIYHNNDNKNSLSSSPSSLSLSIRSKDNNSNLLDARSRQVIVLPPPPYDGYIIEYYKDRMLEEAEKLYNLLVDQIVCEVVNENVSKQPTEEPSSLLTLSSEEAAADDKQEHDKQNDLPPKNNQ